MRLSKVLVPIDFSTSSLAAIDYATALAAGAQAELIFAHVVVPPADFAPSPESSEGRPYSLHSQEDPGAKQLESLRPTPANVRFTHRLLSGDPARELVGLANREQIDLIVMASHGHTRLAQLLLGSVADAVVRGAPCPVFILRLPTTGTTGGS